MKKIGVIAGEHSGDQLAAELLRALAQKDPTIVSEGIAGPHMQSVGCHSFYDMERLSVMGFIDPLKRLPELFSMRRNLYQHFIKTRPDVFVGVDAPAFNLGLELKLKRAGIKTVHYVSPSVWAWRKKRIFKIKKSVDLMLTIFPFENKIYEEHDICVKYVGHPMADTIPLFIEKRPIKIALELEEIQGPWVAILPGSRESELTHMGVCFLETAKWCFEQRPDLNFIIPVANAARRLQIEKQIRDTAPHLPIRVVDGQARQILAIADVALIASGTATLEAMLLQCPMVIAYRMQALNYHIARALLNIECIGLPNLLAGKQCVPEFIQDRATPVLMGNALLNYLSESDRVIELKKIFHTLHQQLRCGASVNAANAILELL